LRFITYFWPPFFIAGDLLSHKKQLKPNSMKKFTMLSFLLILSLCIYSQDYLIHFAGTGGSTSVSTVKVENLTQGTNLTVNGTDILHLRAVLATGINNVYNTSENSLKVYPNPATEYTNIEFIATDPGNALIAIYDQVGKTIVQLGTYLEQGTHTYQINGLSSGLYTVRVTSGKYSYTGKIISQQKSTAIARITYKSFSDGSKNEFKLKSANATIQMQYTAGDRLKITGISGNYSTILTDIPTGNKTVTFDFIACTDGDNNNYPVVKVGAQTWMADNLKTTKFNDGNIIPRVTDSVTWTTLITPAFCWYNNDADTYKDSYGGLYNWFTVNTGKLCPTGWQVPADGDWTALTTYLGGQRVAGSKLKETGTTHWLSPNVGATNEIGFTALPGGYRRDNAKFWDMGSNGTSWSATEGSSSSAYYRSMFKYDSTVYRDGLDKKWGFSVRCLKEPEGTITDIEGNIYHTVTIGTQTWMVENLKTTKYNDGTDIPHGTPETWPDLTTPAYCWYNDSSDKYKDTYGALYNWYAVDPASTGGKSICPAGWHVPSDEEWTTLINNCGGETVAGDKLKETGATHWIYDNIGTNEFGFTALPAGARWDFEDFCCLGYKAFWWSTTEYDAGNGWFRFMDGYPDVYRNGYDKYKGMSVRCVKNN
jgi:uncharacterized protein (TIGR02145 family)